MPCQSSLPKPRSSVMWCRCEGGPCARARRNSSLSSGARCFVASINASMFCEDMLAVLLSTRPIGGLLEIIADFLENVAKENHPVLDPPCRFQRSAVEQRPVFYELLIVIAPTRCSSNPRIALTFR